MTLLLIPQFAFASIRSDELRTILDEYFYTVTVEWDQKNPLVLMEAERKLEAEMLLLAERGLTLTEVSDATGIELRELKNASQKSDVFLLRDYLKENMAFHKGASWNGEVLAPVIVVGTFVVIMSVLIISANKKYADCLKNNGGNEDACIER